MHTLIALFITTSASPRWTPMYIMAMPIHRRTRDVNRDFKIFCFIFPLYRFTLVSLLYFSQSTLL